MERFRAILARVSNRRERAWLLNGLAVLVLLTLVLGSFIHEAVVDLRNAPPSPNCTLAQLRERVPPPSHLAVVLQQGTQRIVWIGPLPPYTIRSGPPCYVFDARGRLLGWSPQTGEGGRWDEWARAAYRSKTLRLEEVSHLAIGAKQRGAP
ncbi:hypothetical protein V5E97_23820 [Singulisphaera sp. Ch08]|uniref:Uncharacterized protein n=1 Tax=Singulisphaera sp. Ch08 TaxID=3120278 RepID=A0AAU7C8B3_9BACT